jgi:hypothetical protein
MNEPCPSHASLTALLHQTLAEHEQLEVANHVDRCKACQTWLEEASGKPDSAIPQPPG